MKTTASAASSFHSAGDSVTARVPVSIMGQQFTYTFNNFFHPRVDELIQQLNQKSLAAMLDPKFLSRFDNTPQFFDSDYKVLHRSDAPLTTVEVVPQARNIDVSLTGPYAGYNWELLFHIPVTIAVHLSNNQRFAEAQKWFHYVFDPTSTDSSKPPPERFWRFLAFRSETGVPTSIDHLLDLLSQHEDKKNADSTGIHNAYNAILTNPFQPYVVARTRTSAFQYFVVMKYLDNLIAWGDNLFTQDTIETLNEATLCYVLAANILGPRPQVLPQRGLGRPQNYAQLKKLIGKDPLQNAKVRLENQFPFNQAPLAGKTKDSGDSSGALFGMYDTPYFCTPPNQTLLGYWDIVADRLFKIRNSENIQGIVQHLPLFDPPLDPGMLVKAAAAGIDISSVVSGLNQPIGPSRSLFLIQKALELAGEVKSLGNALLSAWEKGEAEQLAVLRQTNEVALQTMTQNVRFLQWKQAQEATNSLLKTQATTHERYAYYLRLLNIQPDANAAVAAVPPDRRELTEDNFDDAYSALVGTYEKPIATMGFPPLPMAQGQSPANQAGTSGSGYLYLNAQEDAELNAHMPSARDQGLAASLLNMTAGAVAMIPDFTVETAYWGIGPTVKVFGGSMLAEAVRANAEVLQMQAAWERDQGAIASKTASYQRRADDWLLQANLAARELMQIGGQIIGSLIAEQVAYHEYQLTKTQIQQSQAVLTMMQNKFTNADLYTWMQSQLSGLYYQYYRFAFDTARRAEQTMKQELMRPELDQTTFVQFNYWDTGHQGLLSGEALYLDIKRMEMAYHDNNKRELELTRHVSLRQLDPVALLKLKITGSCTVDIPEWLYDLSCPGHYMRRIKSVSLSVPSVVGPYASVNCTVILQQSSVRISPLPASSYQGYPRTAGADDQRFTDYFGSIDTIVTSSGTNDSGMFETNLKDERFLPFEGAGAISTWNLSLPGIRTFDYMTISDVILHIRYTARDAGGQLAVQATKAVQDMLDKTAEQEPQYQQAPQYLTYCLRYDFPTEWSAFVKGPDPFTITLEKSHFPYLAQIARTLAVDSLTLYAQSTDHKLMPVTVEKVNCNDLSSSLNDGGSATVSISEVAKAIVPKSKVPMQSQLVFLVLKYHFGSGKPG